MTSARVPLVIACVLFLAACDSPTDPIAESFLLQGELTQGGSEVHSLPLDDAGIVAIDVLRLRPTTVDAIDLNLVIGFGIGRPLGAICSTTSQTVIREGDHLVYGLSKQEFCIRLFDRGDLSEDAVIEYTLEVSSD